MSMALHQAEKRFSRTMGKLLQKNQMNTALITVRYLDKAEGPDFDPNVESSYETLTPKSVLIKGFIHFVTARTVLRQFAEIQAGDAILTLEGEVRAVDADGNETGAIVDFNAMQKVTFEVAGVTYVQSSVGKDLAAYWSTVIGNNQLSRTLLLRRP